MKNRIYSGPMDVLGIDAIVYGTTNMLDDGCEYPFFGSRRSGMKRGAEWAGYIFFNHHAHLFTRSILIGGEYTALVTKGFGYVWIGVGVLDEGFCFVLKQNIGVGEKDPLTCLRYLNGLCRVRGSIHEFPAQEYPNHDYYESFRTSQSHIPGPRIRQGPSKGSWCFSGGK